jgi:hypothetical protein
VAAAATSTSVTRSEDRVAVTAWGPVAVARNSQWSARAHSRAAAARRAAACAATISAPPCSVPLGLRSGSSGWSVAVERRRS